MFKATKATDSAFYLETLNRPIMRQTQDSIDGHYIPYVPFAVYGRLQNLGCGNFEARRSAAKTRILFVVVRVTSHLNQRAACAKRHATAIFNVASLGGHCSTIFALLVAIGGRFRGGKSTAHSAAFKDAR
jgi:hypothetical protein